MEDDYLMESIMHPDYDKIYAQMQDKEEDKLSKYKESREGWDDERDGPR